MKKDAKDYYRKKLEAFPDKEKRIFVRPDFDQKQVRTIHLVGICGTAMGSLAKLFVEAGFIVSGSDKECYPPMSTHIKSMGVVFYEGYDAENIKDKDLLVIGNAVGPDNLEVVRAREDSIPQISLAEALQRFFFPGKKPLVVAGTHGKTTTTSLLIHVFKEAGLKPSYMVGGIMQGELSSSHLDSGNHFIIEGDEYNTSYFDKSPKFLNYDPHTAIVTSVEFDHADVYDDKEDYKKAFEFFINELPAGGRLVLYGDSDSTLGLRSYTKAEVWTYGFSEENNIVAKNIERSSGRQTFDFYMNGERLGRVEYSLSGGHNLLNALAVAGIAMSEGISFEEISDALKNFKGVKRRQELLAEVGGVAVIDDFAHHPTAVRETVSAIKQAYPDRRLVAIFEPRSNTSRTTLFQKEYGESFFEADRVYISSPKHIKEDEELIDVKKISEAVSARVPAKHFYSTDALLSTLTDELLPGDVALIMSNGSFDDLHNRLIESLKKKYE
jgi:UDP-N-acetylmuramate: L-alanyl-gamma-D-glutamyl-meso-diaminopimelate ligase